MKATLKQLGLAAMVGALSGCGAFGPTIDQLDVLGERGAQRLRQYHLQVLFPAFAVAAAEDRLRYRDILDSADETCGTAPLANQRKWLRCHANTERHAAEILGVQSFRDYIVQITADGWKETEPVAW